MKGFYIENFVLRLIFCVVGIVALWVAVRYIRDVIIFHESFSMGVLDFAIPVACGVVEAFVWKPKN